METMDKDGAILRYKKSIYSGVILLAVVLRLAGLGSASLTMNEAENAMAALHLFRGGGNGQLLYTLPTALIFKLFGSSEFTARLFPALMGSVLVLIPWFLREKSGYRKAFLLSFMLAVDPVLLFWSKRADAVIPALTLAAVSFVLLWTEKKITGLIALLITLCGGARIWPILIVFVICAAAAFLLKKTELQKMVSEKFSRRDLLTAVLAFVLFCTAFGTCPAGLGYFGRGFSDSFHFGAGWQYPGAAAELAALLLYCGIPLLFCLITSIQTRKVLPLLFSLLAGAILLLWQGVIILPWFTVLLWWYAADRILQVLENIKGQKDFAFFTAACVIPAAYAFFYFRLVEVFSQVNGNELIRLTMNGTIQQLPLTRFQGTILLMAASLLIIALVVRILMGFLESDSIRRGMICGFLLILSWSLVTGIWNTGGFDREGDHPLSPHLKNTANILNGTYTSYTDSALFAFLKETIAKHGDKTYTGYGLNFVTDDPMLEWALRDIPEIRESANRNTDLTGVDLILTKNGESFDSKGYVSAKQNYRGTMDWRRFSFRDWGRWLIFGDGKPVEEAPISLWVTAEYVYSSQE